MSIYNKLILSCFICILIFWGRICVHIQPKESETALVQKRKLAVGVVVTMTMMVLQVLQSMRCQNRFFPTIGTPLLTSPTLLKQGH